MDLAYEVSTAGDAIIITPTGELDVATAPGFRTELFHALEGSPKRLVIALGELSFIDSSGLSAILAAHQQCQQSGTRLYVAGARPNVAKVFEITALDGVLAIHESVDAALAT